MGVFDDQLNKVQNENGFIAALDQSGGSTPKALKLYGVEESEYSDDKEMFNLVHQMRSRIVCSQSFCGKRVLGAILFENTLDRDIAGKNSAAYLWQEKNVVPFLKVDKGLSDLQDDVQIMKPIDGLDALLAKAKSRDVFGTKMRSVIKANNEAGIGAIVAQQFEVGKKICAAGLIPIIEPEVDINSPSKSAAEVTLKREILAQLDNLADDQKLMLKLTLPNQANFYKECVEHPNVIRVVALSGGYNREEANQKLAANQGVIASFSRALTEGLNAKISDQQFDAILDQTISEIYEASAT